MKIRRKAKTFPRVEATALTDTAGIDSLKKLSDDALKAALVSAGEVEAWQLTVAKGMEKDDPANPLIEPYIAAAMHSRIAREVMGIELVMRGAVGELPPEANGQGKPKGGGYL
jgi:hypothetical protein